MSERYGLIVGAHQHTLFSPAVNKRKEDEAFKLCLPRKEGQPTAETPQPPADHPQRSANRVHGKPPATPAEQEETPDQHDPELSPGSWATSPMDLLHSPPPLKTFPLLHGCPPFINKCTSTVPCAVGRQPISAPVHDGTLGRRQRLVMRKYSLLPHHSHHTTHSVPIKAMALDC